MTPRASRADHRLSLRSHVLVVAAGLLLCGLRLDSAPDTVKITVPAAVSFAVTNVNVNTVGAPSPTTFSFSQLSVLAGHVLRIGVKADSNFVPPSGASIPASNVSWTTTGASNGTGSSGVLSTSAYSQLFQSTLTKKAGSVDVTWTLSSPGTPLRAGNHVLTVRWKLESIIP